MSSASLIGPAKAMWRIPQKALVGLVLHPKNRLARNLGSTRFVDKLLKCTKSSADLASGILSSQGGMEASLATAQHVSKSISQARGILGLANAFRGALPGCVQSVRACYDRITRCMDPMQKSLRHVYVAEAVREASSAVSSAGYLVTFAGLRPVLVANQLTNTPFLNRHVKQGLGDGVNYVMAASHAAGVLGATAALIAENSHYRNVMASQFERMSAGDRILLRTRHRMSLKGIILNLLEKFLELLGDMFKLVPMGLAAGVQMAASSGCVILSCMIGLYTMWGKA